MKVRTKYIPRTVVHISKLRYVVVIICWAWKVSSSMEMTDTMAESLMIDINCPAKAGNMRCMAWGNITCSIVRVRLMPRAVEASHWPVSMDSMPARTISAMYAASNNANVIRADRN